MPEYISAAEAAVNRGSSQGRARKLREGNRIPDIAKFRRKRLLPEYAENPLDGKTKKERGTTNEAIVFAGR